jgi:hypothetical protein
MYVFRCLGDASKLPGFQQNYASTQFSDVKQKHKKRLWRSGMNHYSVVSTDSAPAEAADAVKKVKTPDSKVSSVVNNMETSNLRDSTTVGCDKYEELPKDIFTKVKDSGCHQYNATLIQQRLQNCEILCVMMSAHTTLSQTNECKMAYTRACTLCIYIPVNLSFVTQFCHIFG